MSLDLGELGDLATAVGLIDANGPVPDWFQNPGDHLSKVLSNPVQRAALVSFVDALLGDADGTTDANGVSWLPVVDGGDGAFRLFVTLGEDSTSGIVRVGAGVRVRVAGGGVECELDAHVPLFLADGSDPLLFGKAGAPVDVALRLRFPPSPTTGRIELAGAELGATVPTTSGESPSVRLALRGLRMPGASAARDLVVDAANAGDLDDVLLELVLGLVAAQAATIPAPLSGLVSMLGLADDAVPDLPIADLIARGPVALADWFAAALSGPSRQAWMTALQTFVGGTSVIGGDAVEVTVAGAPVRLELLLSPGASARPVVTPRVTAGVTGGGGARLAFSADLVAIDLGGGALLALPRLALTGRLDPPGATKLVPTVTGPSGLQVSVGALEVGFALDANRRPVLVVTAEDADVGATHYDVLDLSTPEALAAVGGQAIADAAAALFAAMGPAGDAIAIVLGLKDPPSIAGLPLVNPGELLRDPVGAVRERWRALVSTQAGAVPAVLTALKNAIADARATTGVSGTGTQADPWRVPLAPRIDLQLIADGDRLIVGCAAEMAVDTDATGIRQTLALQMRIATLDLVASTAAFLAEVHARLTFADIEGPLSLSVGDLAASVSSLGIDLAWAPQTGLRVLPIAADARVRLASMMSPVDIDIPPFVFGADGRLALSDAGWAAVEELVAALAAGLTRRADLPWLTTLVPLLGWGSRPDITPVVGAPSLRLAALLADPAAALENFARALLLDEATLRRLLEALGETLAERELGGRAATIQPWVVPLVGAIGALANRPATKCPSLIVTLGTDGAARPSAFAPQPIRGWVPGEDGLSPDALAAALAQEGQFDDVVDDMLAGRGDLAQGLVDLIDRWTGTDGLVTLPNTGLPTGVTPHWPAQLTHDEPLAGSAITQVLAGIWTDHFGGTAPSTVIFVAIEGEGRNGAPPVLPTALPADRVIDLTAAGLPPEAFTPPSPPTGAGPHVWAVRLGSRASCRLAAGADPDGVSGQAARLRRALTPLTGAGADVAVVAHGGAGHAAVRAVDGLAGVRTVVTIGTPWSPVSVDTLDAVPAGDALRLLAAFLRMAGTAANADIALARGAIGALLDLDAFSDPLADISLPGNLSAPSAIPVHAVVGSLSPTALQNALTAVAGAALAARASARAAALTAIVAPVRAGLRLPIIVGGSGGVTADLFIDVDLAGVARDSAIALDGPSVRVRLDIGAASGWLVGGPDPGRASGGARVLACRRVSASVALPIPSWDSARAAPAPRARLVLHDVTAFGTVRDRWTVETGTGASADATPLLPEVRAVLAEVAARIAFAAGTDPVIAALRSGLTALGIIGPDGGLDAITLERLLLDPVPTVGAVRDDATRRQQLAAALRAMAGDTRAAAVAQDTVDLQYGGAAELTAHIDLAARSLTMSAGPTASTSGAGRFTWAAGVTAAPGGVSASLRLGDDIATTNPAANGPPGFGVLVTASAAGLAAVLRQKGPDGTKELPLWPAPSVDGLLDRLTTAVPALALQTLIDALRQRLASASAPAAAAIDALLDAAGLFTAATGPDARTLRSLYSVVANPAAWVNSLPTGLAGSMPALVDAIRGVLGATGAAGTMTLTEGVTLRAATSGARLLVSLDIDAAAFTPPTAGALDVVIAGSLGLSVSTNALEAPLPDITMSVGVAGAGVIRLRVGPDAGGAGNAIGVTLSVTPTNRPEIIIFPGGPGLGGLANAAAAGAVAALPVLLDAIAAMDPATGTPTTIGPIAGRVVARVGDALGLRTGATPKFDAAALAAFGSDPAAALSARAASIAASGLTLLTQAVQPLLGSVATRSVAVSGSALVVTLAPVTVRWRPGTSRIEADVTLTGVPGVASLSAAVAVTPAGLALLDVTAGPASLSAGALTLAPYARVATGSEATGQIAEVGLGVGTNRRLAFQWDVAAGSAGLRAFQVGATLVALTDPAKVAATVAGAVLDLAGSVVLAVGAVQTAMTNHVLGAEIKKLLENVVLVPNNSTRLDPAIVDELADPGRLLRRLAQLAANLATASGANVEIDGKLVVKATLTNDPVPVLGLNLAIKDSWDLNPGSDIVVSLEEDATWIQPLSGPVPEGVTVSLMTLPPPASPVAPQPRLGLTVGGLGIRLSRAGGPLLNAGVSIGSIAVHLFGSIKSSVGPVSLAGGVRLELASLGVALAGASGGSNAVAQGVMGQAGTGDDAPVPRFSPAIAVQQHAGQPLRISLTAGPGSGPWWITIGRKFGPVYIEQVGLAVVNPPEGIESVGILIDGGVSLMGLAASVDDLSLTYVVAGGGSALDPSKWSVDLAGFAVAADISGLMLAGGLRRFTPEAGGVEYLGMLMARMSVYGVSVYGGYGLVGVEPDRYASMFLFGAVNGPIGGPPAFFVTGIGGGFGINRRLVVPSDLSQFGSYPLIKALDPSARLGDPFKELEAARGFFPPERGTFWFAAGISFNSFALVDGVAVLAVQIGSGLEINLLGLARMALPRPEAALVSIELALVARFSTREGIILVQGQLTDNSWLLLPEVRLTGGFAFASWFSGPNRGQFVVTIGGYHPDFHRDGYPQVPRLGIAVRIGNNISIIGTSYFALTSEAVMAGTRMEISATLGPAWAHLVFGGDAIVFFDPFWFKVSVYASIDAGVTIKIWRWRVTLSVHLSARIDVSGPPLYVVARFEVGPVGLTLEFGDKVSEPVLISWEAFVSKYLEEASPGVARVLAAVAGNGSIPPSGSDGTGGAVSPDGTPDRPFRVLAEFEITVTSTAPLLALDAGNGADPLAASHAVSVAPMGEPANIQLTLQINGPQDDNPQDHIKRLKAVPQQLGAFPIGTWGIAPNASNPKVPSGDVISATDRVLLQAIAKIPGENDPATPTIKYRQVETRKRRILPFVTENDARRNTVLAATTQLKGLIPAATDANMRLGVAATLLSERGGRSAADVAAWRADRSASPLLGSLGEGLGGVARAVETVDTAPAPAPAPAPLRPPQLRALMMAPEAREPMAAARTGAQSAPVVANTTLSERLRKEVAHVVAAPPRLADVDAGLAAAVPARLLRLATPAAQAGATVVAAMAPPLTRTVLAGIEIGASRATAPAAAARLAAFEQALVPRRSAPTAVAVAPRAAAHVAAGEIAVLELPDAARDADSKRRPNLLVGNGRARVVALGPAGGIFADQIVSAVSGARPGTLIVPPTTRALAVIGLPTEPTASSAAAGALSGLAGWVADVPLPSATDGVLIAAGCVVDALGRIPRRGVAPLRAGWVAPDELVSGESAVTTTFAAPVVALAVALEGGTGPDVVLGIDGAQRPTEADGGPQRPILVADGSRAVLVFRLIASRPGTAFTVKTGDARRLTGVVAAPAGLLPGIDAAPALAEAIGRVGLGALVPPVAEPGQGGADLAWKED